MIRISVCYLVALLGLVFAGENQALAANPQQPAAERGAALLTISFAAVGDDGEDGSTWAERCDG